MSGVWGEYLKLSIFGESHGKGVGIVLNGLPAGLELDLDYIHRELSRRAPGKSSLATARQEADNFEILSGFFDSRTTGAPFCAIIWNKDQHSGDYEDLKNILRPGHADYTGRIKYLGFNDYRGGGHFSGRLTAPLVLAGAIAKQILSMRKVVIGSHILSIGDLTEDTFDPLMNNPEDLRKLREKEFPVLDKAKGIAMKEKILQLKAEDDSIGGVVETAVIGLPVGLGSPFFDSVESKLAHLLFAIPAVKGVEFGAGFGITQMRGSEANDPFSWQDNKVRTLSNHSGGIQGGLTNGMPIIFRTAFKPTPSIGVKQKTIDLVKLEEVELRIKGRHDPCIVPRAVPVVEAAAALAFMDMMIEKDGTTWMN
jgi:chorismate synthase